MNWFLFSAFLVIAILFLRHRKHARDQWRAIERMIEAIETGGRPSSFILHGEKPLQRIGLGLEKLILQRDRLESQISREGFNLQAILASMVEGVMVIDNQRVIRLANDSLIALFNLKSGPVGKGTLQTLRDAAIEGVLRKAMSTGEAQFSEISLSFPTRCLGMSAAPVRDSAGAIQGVAATFHDITRIKELEQVRRDFVANVSHELRTPLSIFQGYVELLRENPELPRDEVAETLLVLSKHSTRLNALVEDLLTIARLESRQDEPILAPLNLAEFLRGIEVDWKLKFQLKEIRFGVELGGELPTVCADAFRLEQVFNNLLENALKYTPASGSVRLRAERARRTDGALGSEVELRVTDTGSGIPAADLPHVFERFYRADKARSRALGGTGLGLSIVKHIVQIHGGNVRAESELGVGSTFIVRLPGIG
jgi:two-component system phosphate regulon sensor histidine kinase PhoR